MAIFVSILSFILSLLFVIVSGRLTGTIGTSNLPVSGMTIASLVIVTLLFVSIKNNKYIAGHIGDGIIGIIDEKGDAIVLSEPENGEFANTTYFTTSENYKYHLRLYREIGRASCRERV